MAKQKPKFVQLLETKCQSEANGCVILGDRRGELAVRIENGCLSSIPAEG